MADRGNQTIAGPIAKLRDAAQRNPAAERLFTEIEEYLGAQTQHLVSSAGKKLGSATQRMAEAAEGGGKAELAAEGGAKLAQGESPGRAAVEAGAKGLKEKVKGAVRNLTRGGDGRGSSGGKFNNIVENCDVGVPVHVAYNQWTRYQDFSRFTRGVLSVEHADDVTSDWRLKVAKSQRSLKATVTEQIPDQRIAWTTSGAKGTIRGVVTFHPLGENLTRILLVIEYYPSGFFEKTANMWWAASRRVRLDLKHYRRFVMMQGEETGGWRGEIRDGEVVRDHDDVVAEEEAAHGVDADGSRDDSPVDSEDRDIEADAENSKFDDADDPPEVDDDDEAENDAEFEED